MNLIDLTHPISPEMPVYPGTEPPVFITRSAIDDDGFLEKKMTLYSHTGTHIDAPAHLIGGARTLDRYPASHFFGSALLFDRTEKTGPVIGVEQLAPFEEAIRQVEFLLIRTGWSRHWGRREYFSGYPVLSVAAAERLARFGLKGIGLDTISADADGAAEFPVHKAIFQSETVIIENLAHLDRLPGDRFAFSCLPLRFEDADGSPVRAVAVID